jgi:hypothetical protein
VTTTSSLVSALFINAIFLRSIFLPKFFVVEARRAAHERAENVSPSGLEDAAQMVDTADKSAFIATIFDCRFVEAMSF